MCGLPGEALCPVRYASVCQCLPFLPRRHEAHEDALPICAFVVELTGLAITGMLIVRLRRRNDRTLLPIRDQQNICAHPYASVVLRSSSRQTRTWAEPAKQEGNHRCTKMFRNSIHIGCLPSPCPARLAHRGGSHARAAIH